MSVKQYPAEVLATQPIGFWTGTADRAIVAYLRRTLAKEQLTLPQWWSAPPRSPPSRAAGRGTPSPPASPRSPAPAWNSARSSPDSWSAAGPTTGTAPSGSRRPATPDSAKARARMEKAYARIRDGITEAEFVAAVDVLRRMVDNVGEDSDLL
ncbi:hypothetical protein ACU686_04440 [Yinghuangia aomiensis]